MAKKTRNEARLRRAMRVRKKVTGTPDRPRMSVFRSLSDIYVQVIDDTEGKTLVSASTIDHELKSKLSKKNKTEQAQLVGKLVGERAISKGIETVIFDRSGYKYIGRVKALADSAREAGLKF